MQNILQAGDLLNIQNTTQELTPHTKIPDRLKTKHHPPPFVFTALIKPRFN